MLVFHRQLLWWWWWLSISLIWSLLLVVPIKLASNCSTINWSPVVPMTASCSLLSDYVQCVIGDIRRVLHLKTPKRNPLDSRVLQDGGYATNYSRKAPLWMSWLSTQWHHTHLRQARHEQKNNQICLIWAADLDLLGPIWCGWKVWCCQV